ncbi:MAG: S-methyl-5'-thioadenosine phosphorylase [Anaerolineae bacterium SM23_ 63]|nr:MAG: S-methyl-5'-thioadenosine phosphorylase [Anaerolineae bacterium SM23_ 63]HEY46784.1 S-methyl-5'-thioadenosine phosphorylase [Anaerolineae bacterium]
MEQKPVLGVIGGSGLYGMEGLDNIESHQIDTPFGKPSSPVIIGDLKGQRIAFLARHGVGHVLSPSEVNYQANIYALKVLGIDRVISVSACGSLREDYAPGDIVVPDQLFDRTHHRKRTFFGNGLVAHISVGNPFCMDLSELLFQSVAAAEGTVHHGGAFITIEGPRFSTRAESNTYRAWGMSIIGMTTSPEAFLAREAEMCYAVMAHVTDYDVWHVTEEPVTVEMIVRILTANTQLAQKAIAQLVSSITEDRSCDCREALKDTFITSPEKVPQETRSRLSIFIDKYIS